MIALWLGLGLLNAGAEPPVTAPAVGGISYQQAESEWNARRKWSAEIERLLEDPAEAAPVEGSTPTQAAQERQEPRTAQPAPIRRIAPSAALSGLVEAMQPYAEAQAQVAALLAAIAQRDRLRAIEQALALDALRLQMEREDEEAVLMLLLEIA